MIRILDEKLKSHKSDLQRNLKLYYENNKIKSFKDLFKIICISLRIGGVYIDDIVEIDRGNGVTNKLLIINYGEDYNEFLITYIKCRESEYDEYDILEEILMDKDINIENAVSDLMEICITMTNNTVNPYDNTGRFAKIE